MGFICVLNCILSSKYNSFLALLLFALFEYRNTAKLYARIFLTKKRALTGQNIASWVKTKITNSRKGGLTRFYKRRALFFRLRYKKR